MKPRLCTGMAVMLLALGASGCGKSEGTKAAAAPASGERASPTNRIAVPAAVRQNLGITFARVERRNVSSTLRLPGRFELLPTGRREYRAALPGRVELAVAELQRIRPGDVLYRLDSARWRELQEQLAMAEAQRDGATARLNSMGPLLDAHRQHRASLEAKVALWESRAAQLEKIREAGGGQRSEFTSAQAALREAQAELADVVEKMAELEATRLTAEADSKAAFARKELLLAGASTLTGVTVEQLSEQLEEAGQKRPRWRTLGLIEVRAVAGGVVERLEVRPGAFVEPTALVVSVVQPEAIRFRAQAPQSDLERVRAGLPARIVPPRGGTIDLKDTMEAELQVGLVADADQRTIDLIATPKAAPAEGSGAAGWTWARAGVSGFLEITLAGGLEELAIPQSCVVRDGVTAVLFRRDPKDADSVIRMEADLGVSDGRWVTVLSGLREGDEVVLDGVYPLLLATSGSAPKGGHFHSDGTFHEGGHEEGKEGGR